MNPLYHQAKFINSSPHLKNTPADEGKEIAFAGRSNAGKSSAINTLTRQNSLARISKTPGRTQMLNFFEINEHKRFVDLPGYGYAKVPWDVKQDWHKLMETYLTSRKSLCAIILVMDIRHPLTEFDWQMVEWCQHSDLPLHILLTKSDKLTFGAAKNTLLQVQRDLQNVTIPLSLQMFSSLKKIGVDEVHLALDALFELAPVAGVELAI
ncbi:MAG: ribosome biogenesis GTP-binding protein YihA/YsxC [Methylovulum sp.]|uniref:ribosome biogenesis GTP-binding protein YihA/YsxC n=1 Tax=Methylovulum sp. TaxID=1916980 RepID=UPI0026115AD3|nr:ribosome biogenesis GTP-binding protein YihA/YsxC [Methylovulum sp.]MDD2724498.1 ribosome biogenesis GTP-binding protein YihA/YsxC [Methylovulum sp.]MDD5124112.1 ribosome biogenesis GTP-binding protein YihA/YsxC [Methylovulum sp.]